MSREPILTERVRSSEPGPTTLKMAISVLIGNAYCYDKYPRYLPITGTEKWLTHSSKKKKFPDFQPKMLISDD